jgi:hypothetical protein
VALRVGYAGEDIPDVKVAEIIDQTRLMNEHV